MEFRGFRNSAGASAANDAVGPTESVTSLPLSVLLLLAPSTRARPFPNYKPMVKFKKEEEKMRWKKEEIVVRLELAVSFPARKMSMIAWHACANVNHYFFSFEIFGEACQAKRRDDSLTVGEKFINVLFECVLVTIERICGQRFQFVFFARMIQRRVQ